MAILFYQPQHLILLPFGGGVAPVAAFVGQPLSGGSPLNVQFTDQSTNTPTSWLWTFGDGSTSTLQNPQHIYTPGSYTVSLKATNASGSNTLTKIAYIVVGGGGDSTGYRRKRRVLRRIFKRSAQARKDAEAFLKESAASLTSAGVLSGTTDEELQAFRAVLRDVLGYAEQKVYTLVHLAVVDALLQALEAEAAAEEEGEEEQVLLTIVRTLH